MSEDQQPSHSLDFELDPKSPSKGPQQLVALLGRVLGDEFPDVVKLVDIMPTRGNSRVSVRNLEKLDEQTSKDFVHRARVVFNDFMSSPWY